MKLKQYLATSLLLGALLMPVTQATGLPVADNIIQDTIKQLDIMMGDQNGSMNLDKTVSRSEFAAMLVSASPYKNVTTHFGYTLFPDVPSSHWASGYVKVVVEQGYMVGQVDGYFSPDRAVLLEEAVTAVLCLLGYDTNTLSGTYPFAQLSKYYELDLDDYMSAQAGQALTREDCMYLFFNLLNTKTTDGTLYANKLGYASTTYDEIDTIALTRSFTQGPYIVGQNTLPTALNTVDTIYRNDKATTSTALEHYDICYYNSKLNTVWVYDQKVTGRLTYVDDYYSPSRITVAGKDYTLESTTVKYKFMAGGDFVEGDVVTLLLGQYDMVSDVVSASVTDTAMVGLVLGNGVVQLPDGYNDTTLSRYVTVVTTDGEVLEIDSNGLYNAGRLVEISYNGGVQSVKGVGDKNLTGTVNSTATKIGDYVLAEDVSIIEITGSQYSTIYPMRLAGYTLKDEDVRYYSTNSRGEIDQLMIEDVTGDTAQYVYISATNTTESGFFNIVRYSYYYNGAYTSYTSETRTLNGKKGAAYFEYDDWGVLSKIINLESVELTSVNVLQGAAAGKIYDMADDIQVYETFRNAYQQVSLTDVDDLDRYTLTAYYDQGIFSAGNKIRLIIAELK